MNLEVIFMITFSAIQNANGVIPLRVFLRGMAKDYIILLSMCHNKRRLFTWPSQGCSH